MMMEEDAIWDGAYSSPTPEKSIKEKKAQVKRLLEDDTELLNDIIVNIRKDKIDKLKNIN